MKSFFALLCFFLLSSSSAQTTREGYRLSPKTTINVNAFGICQAVKNNSPQRDYFIPTKTAAEWAAFRNNRPQDIEFLACCQSKASVGCNAQDNNLYWLDSCGNREELKQTCDYQCQGTACRSCVQCSVGSIGCAGAAPPAYSGANTLWSCVLTGQTNKAGTEQCTGFQLYASCKSGLTCEGGSSCRTCPAGQQADSNGYCRDVVCSGFCMYFCQGQCRQGTINMCGAHHGFGQCLQTCEGPPPGC